MNSSGRLDDKNEAFAKNLVSFIFLTVMNSFCVAFVYTYVNSNVFQRKPRYLLYIHLVINDMLFFNLSVTLQILTYATNINLATCCVLLLFTITTSRNSPVNLAGMALERYIAICHPLQHSQLCTERRTCVLIAMIWVANCLPALVEVFIVVATRPPSAFTSPILCYMTFVYNTTYHTVQRAVTQALMMSLVFLTVVTTYLKVFFVARSSTGQNHDSARKARNTIMLHGMQLFTCMLSYITAFVTVALISAWPRSRTSILFASFLLVSMCPRLLSLLIYGVRDDNFRKHLRINFCKSCHVVK